MPHPAWFHNTLLNVGQKRRGLGYRWQEDLLARLEAVERRELVFRLVLARWGTFREHYTILVHARDPESATGVVLDAWRPRAAVCVGPVQTDKYPWRLTG